MATKKRCSLNARFACGAFGLRMAAVRAYSLAAAQRRKPQRDLALAGEAPVSGARVCVM